MIRKFLGAAIVAVGALAVTAPQPVEAATVGYWGTFSGGGILEGRFGGYDLNGDEKITTDELTDFYARLFAGSPGSPSYYVFTATSVSNFLYEWTAVAGGVVSGFANGMQRITYCDGYGQIPCMMMDQLYGPNWGPKFEMRPISIQFSADNVTVASAVPGPATLPLLAGGLAILAVAKRRKRATGG